MQSKPPGTRIYLIDSNSILCLEIKKGIEISNFFDKVYDIRYYLKPNKSKERCIDAVADKNFYRWTLKSAKDLLKRQLDKQIEKLKDNLYELQIKRDKLEDEVSDEELKQLGILK